MCRLQNYAKVTLEAKVNKRQAEKKLQEHKRATVMKEVRGNHMASICMAELVCT